MKIHVWLVETSISKGELQLVSSAIRELAKSLANIRKTSARRALATATLHKHNGDTEQAIEELEATIAVDREPIDMSNDARMTLACNCLQSGMEQSAVEVMTAVVGNASSSATVACAMHVFREAGRDDLAQRVARESKSQIVELVAAGAERRG